MKHALYPIILSMCLLVCCSGRKPLSGDYYNPVDMPRLTPQNYVDTMLTLIRQYDQEDYYYLFAHNQLCLYEILVNDIPVYQMFRNRKLATSIDINDPILKSGKQTLTFRLYPLDGHGTFPPQASFGFTLYKRNEREGTFASEALVMEYKLPLQENGLNERFIATGESYFEHTVEFEATVPYNHKGWLGGQNLRELDQKKLVAEVERFYQKQRDIMIDRDAEALFSYLYQKETEVRQSAYSKEYNLKRVFDGYMECIITPSFVWESLENYKMVFYGDGQVVALKQQNTEDVRLRGKSALWAKYTDEDGDLSATFCELYLYLPEGKELKAENFIIVR